MRAITGAVVSSEPCTLTEAQNMLSAFRVSHHSYLDTSDCCTYVKALDGAIQEQLNFLCRCGRGLQQQGAAGDDAHGYEAQVEGERERGDGERNWDTKVFLGGHGSVEEVKVPVSAEEKKSKKRKKEEEPHHDDKADTGVPSHAPASPEIVFEQRKKKEKHSSKELVSVVKQEPDLVVEEDGGSERKKKKEKHSSKELVSVVKQEPDLVVEEDGGSERKKKKDKHSDKGLARVVKQEPGLVVEEELVSEKKKAKKKREKDHVKLEEDAVEVKGQIVNDGVVEQGVADGEKKRKKKKHSEKEGGSKGVKEEEDKMAIDSDLNSEKKKKKKKRGRGDDDDDVQEQGEHKKKKQRKESRE